MTIGVCGKSGSGKNYFASKLMMINPSLIHVDIDTIGHKIIQLDNVKQELINYFGEEIVVNGDINRGELAKKVFSNQEHYNKLIDITWPAMEQEIILLTQDKTQSYILNWALLPKTKFFKQCDLKFLIDTPIDIRKQRLLLRDNITEESFRLRENNSLNYNEYIFDFVLQ